MTERINCGLMLQVGQTGLNIDETTFDGIDDKGIKKESEKDLG